MREADFVIAVLKSHSLVDNETIGAIREQFGKLVAIDTKQEGKKDKCINSEVLFKHLLRQQRIVFPGKAQGDASKSRVSRRGSTVYVNANASSNDNGYQVWWDSHWIPEVSLANEVAVGAPSVARQSTYNRLIEYEAEAASGYNA